MKKRAPCSVRLKQLRNKHGETQEVFARKLRVARAQIANLETDRCLPSAELLIRIADRYNVTTDWLLGRST